MFIPRVPKYYWATQCDETRRFHFMRSMSRSSASIALQQGAQHHSGYWAIPKQHSAL